MINQKQNLRLAGEAWDEAIPTFLRYLSIPNKSPGFDKDWQVNGYMDKAAELLFAWVKARKIKGLKAEIIRAPGKTPLLFVEVPATDKKSAKNSSGTVLLYGHMDKQPECSGWL